MDQAVDMFARFVAAVSNHMDDERVPTSALAAELHVSRSLLDRLITAVAGETPARFRRRLLLERAAFQLRTSDMSIIDAAITAGYASNEAFTRAFTRAHGGSPSNWRSASAAFHIAAPNGVHFYPPGGLRLPSRLGVTTMDFAAEFIDHHLEILGQLMDNARELTDDQLDKVIELNVENIDENPTIRSLLSRLVGQLEMWNAAMASTVYDFAVEDHEAVESMHRRLDKSGRAFARYVRQVTEHDRFDETFVDATGDIPYVFTAAGMIAHVITYAAYRRTLVVGALAAVGRDIQDDPLEWFLP